MQRLSPQRIEQATYLSVSFLVLTLTGVLYSWDRSAFKIFLGPLNPIIVLFFLTILGYLLLLSLRKQAGFMIYSPGNNESRLKALSIAIILAIMIAVVDSVAVFPADMNVLLPEAVFYYSSFGYVVEVLFHLAPLWVILSVSRRLFKQDENAVWRSIFFVSLLEPVFQVVLGFSRPIPFWATAYVGVHILLINIQQLRILKKFDFLSMYAFRLVYYLFWHIIWGNMRLDILF